VAAILDLQFVEAKAMCEVVQLRRVGVRDVKPRNTGQRLLGCAHQQEV
jgi:hypothetical protein